MRKALFILFAFCGAGAGAQTPVLVSDVNVGTNPSLPTLLTVFNNKLYFAADDGTNGLELMVWDGTNAPSLVYNINPGNADAFTLSAGVYNTKMAVLNGKLYFGADNGTAGEELMVYDGVNPPSLAAEINAGSTGSGPYWLYTAGNKLFFDAYSSTAHYELFVYDGVNAPVMFDINTGSGLGDPYYFVAYNGKVYFKATNLTVGTELFVYDPGNNTVTVAANIETGSLSSDPSQLIVHDNKIYFTASTVTHGRELYSFDGTTAIRLTDINNGPANSITSGLASYNNQVYFGASATGTQNQLYKYDPGTNTASLVYNINPGDNSAIRVLAVYGNKLYFNATTATNGDELWVHDGTGTTMAANINAAAASSSPRDFTVFDGKLCFAATNAPTGTELYSLTDSALSVRNIRLDGTVSLAPNPTNGDAILQISLNAAMGLSIQLTDISGKLIWSEGTKNYTTGKSSITLPTAGQAAGTYFYRLTNTQGALMASGKFVKQ